MRSSLSLLMRSSQTCRLQVGRHSALRANTAQRMPQDLPPQGGYEPVQYKRNLPAKGLRPVYYVLGAGFVMLFGWYKLAVGIEEWNECAREKMWSRIHLIPLLQAEEDRDQVRRHYAAQEREKELLGSNSKIYNSDRFVRPWYSINPGQDKD